MTTVACFLANKNGSDQTGLSSGSATQVTFENEVYDIGGHFASNLWTPPSGAIHLCARAKVTGTITVRVVQGLGIFKNGTTEIAYANTPAFANLGFMQISTVDQSNGTDTYEVKCIPTLGSGTATIVGDTTLTAFSGHMIYLPDIVLTQSHFRFRIDMDAVDAEPTWGANEDVGQ